MIITIIGIIGIISLITSLLIINIKPVKSKVSIGKDFIYYTGDVSFDMNQELKKESKHSDVYYNPETDEIVILERGLEYIGKL